MTTTLGMSLTDALSPVTKNDFKKWHSEGALQLLNAGNGVLDIVLSRLNDTSVDWRNQGTQVFKNAGNGKNHKAYMFSNGCDEFVIVVDDMQGSDYSREYLQREGKQHLTIYVVVD